MGLFSKFFNATPTEFSFKPKNEQDAWVCILYACSSIDSELSDAEIEALSKIFVFKTFFDGHDTLFYHKMAMEAKPRLSSKGLIDVSVDLISEENKNTLFTLCCEVLLADGILQEDEKQILEYLSSTMKLDDAVAIKIIEVMLYRNKWNKIIA